MNAAKDNKTAQRRMLPKLPALPGTLVLSAVLVVGALAGGVALWNKFGAEATAGPNFTLTAENIELSPQPAWIRSNVKEWVLRDGAVDQLEIRDPQLTVRVAQACELNPWVAEVIRVTKKYPAAVVVDLTYRKPVAMVEVNLHNAPGLLPVDGAGTLLPPDDFSASDARNYLRIYVGEQGPAGQVGSPWGDERVAGAAGIAALLKDVWQPAGLHRVVASAMVPGEKRPPTFEIVTRGTCKVIWGAAPNKERSGEASPTEKLVRLTKLVEQCGAIETCGLREIDLRDPKALITPTRTAQRPGESAP